MGSKKPTIEIVVPNIGSTVYMVATSQEDYFPTLASKPGTFTSRPKTASTMIDLKNQDKYGNKSVLHYGLRGSINAAALDPTFTTVRVLRPGRRTSVTYNLGGNSLTIYGECTDPPRSEWVVMENSPSRVISHYYNYKGKLTDISIATLTGIRYFWGEMRTQMDFKSIKQHFVNGRWVYDAPVIGTWPGSIRPIGKATADYSFMINEYLSDLYNSYFDPVPFLPDVIPEDLGTKFIDSLFIPNVNSMENLKDLKNLKEMIPPLRKLFVKHNIKSLAEFQLWYKYSYSTTEMDIKEFIRVLFGSLSSLNNGKDAKWQSGFNSIYTTRRNQTYNCRTYYTVFHKTYSSSLCEMLGFRVNCSNLWDLLPYTFVIDWFINLGDIFQRLDEQTTIAKVPITSVMVSTKGTSTVVGNSDILAGSSMLTAFYYRRMLEGSLPVAPTCLSLKDPSKQLLTGSALLITNKRRK